MIDNWTNRHAARRRGFTLIELMIAASVTALTLAAAATMVSAVANASQMTKEQRNSKKAGRMIVDRVATQIRSARGIGDVTASSVVLWDEDKNGDDRVNVHETSVIKYVLASKQLIRQYTEPAIPGDVGPEILQPVFTNLSDLLAVLGIYTTKTTVLGEDIRKFTFSGYPTKTETRIVNFALVVKPDGGDAMAFRDSIVPRATADYLFNNNAKVDDGVAGKPLRRLEFSRWTGWADVNGTPLVYP